jgi:hypothetical protein
MPRRAAAVDSRSMGAWIRAAFLCVLPWFASACVPLKQPNAAGRSTTLFSVALIEPGAQSHTIDGLIVTITGDAQNPGGQFAFPVDPASVNGRAEFLVRLDLTPGHYRMSSLAGVMRSGGDDLRFDMQTDMPFEVRGSFTDYLGRVELTHPAVETAADPARIALVDAYQADRTRFIRSWPALRSKILQRRKPQSIALLTQPKPVEVKQRGQGQYLPPTRLDRTAEPTLPAAARAAFRDFLKSQSPRAFAVSGSGGFGSASGGENVVQRALSSCERSSKAKRDCRLFALDDTLVSSIDLSQKPAAPGGATP